NAEVLQVLNASRDNAELFRRDDQVAWSARSTDSEDCYLALFNLGEAATEIEVDFSALSSSHRYEVRDLWQKRDLGIMEGSLRQQIAPHASKLYRLHPVL